jgi:cellulose synthase/poly-beta-1,6-N-acetylglucosamine synthase-like glycosyltransferase
VCAYYIFLAFVSLWRKREVSCRSTTSTRFAILIPAHDEEAGISEVLESCNALDYPKDRYQVYVIADNCSDRTAECASTRSATCFERVDEVHKGKGWALDWAFRRILPEGHDAIVVLDADCHLESKALRVFDDYLQRGATVLQANEVAVNVDESTTSYALALGKFIENELFLTPKSHLGLFVYLQGKGMVLAKEVLEAIPWQAHSITEDTEYTLELLRHRVRVWFVPEVCVASCFPADRDQLIAQRMRWAGGNLQLARSHALRMIWRGIRALNRPALDAGWTFLIGSRVVVLTQLLLTLALCLTLVMIAPGRLSISYLCTTITIMLLHLVYVGSGVVRMGLTTRRLLLLVALPLVVVEMMGISFLALLGRDRGIWRRTPRRGMPLQRSLQPMD